MSAARHEKGKNPAMAMSGGPLYVPLSTVAPEQRPIPFFFVVVRRETRARAIMRAKKNHRLLRLKREDRSQREIIATRHRFFCWSNKTPGVALHVPTFFFAIFRAKN